MSTAESTVPFGPAARAARAFLRVPLFHKILLANVAVLGLAGAAAVFAASRLSAPIHASDLLELGLLGAAVAIPLAALLHSAVVRLALAPLVRIEAAAAAVRRGQFDARMAPSAVADRDLERVAEVFNGMLDTLQAAGRRQRELSQAVLEAQERERQRLSHELYAGTAQTLAGVLMRLRVATRQPAPAAETLQEVRSEIARALDEVRLAARALRPPELDELGVQAALEAHFRSITEGRRIGFSFTGRVPDSALSRPTRLALFRALQEAVTNAVRHARAGEVRVTLRIARDGVIALVRDDGRGFDPLVAEQRPGALGLLGMRERIQYVGGTVTVDSSPGRGTTVLVHVPWSAHSAAETAAARAEDAHGLRSAEPARIG